MRNVRVSTIAMPHFRVGDDPQAEITARINMVLPDKPDLIVMPELCDRTGTTAEYAKRPFLGVPDYIRQIAAENNCYIAFPTITQPDSHWRNSTVMVDRQGNIMGAYHKTFPVISEMENRDILPGEGPVVFDCDFGRVGCIICFDLCFQELSWQYRALEPDLMIFSSAYHGGLMQEFWAYNTLSHFVSASTALQSRILSPVGQVLAHTTNYREYVTADINLDCCAVFLGLNHDKLNNAKEKYGRKVKISDPGHLGAVLFSSETEEFSIMDIVEEFGIEPVRGYFDRVRAVRERYLPLVKQEK